MAAPKKYLVFEKSTGLCVNSIVWDGETPYDPGNGLSLEICPAGSFAGIGWTKDVDGEWIPPVVAERPDDFGNHPNV